MRRLLSSNRIARDMHLMLKTRQRNGVSVVEVRPSQIGNEHQVLVYLHGGAYTFQNSEIKLLQAALMANATKLITVSVDYTLAHRGKWTSALEQVVSVYRSLLEEGFKPSAIAFFGDSTCGGTAAGSILRIRDLKLPMPGALILWSPWSDITATVDTYVTLANADPFLTAASRALSARHQRANRQRKTTNASGYRCGDTRAGEVDFCRLYCSFGHDDCCGRLVGGGYSVIVGLFTDGIDLDQDLVTTD